MKFRILDKKTYANKSVPEGAMKEVCRNESYVIEIDGEFQLAENAQRKLICLGQFSILNNNELELDRSLTTGEVLSHLLVEGEPETIHNSIQGRFVLFFIEDRSVKVVQDSYSRVDVYYSNDEAAPAVASDLALLPAGSNPVDYNQTALAHLLTYYGNRPAKKETIYSSINRLGVSESIYLDSSGLSIVERGFKAASVRSYAKTDNERYSDLFLQTLEQGGSKDGNLVYLSSGWDSTSILAGLVHVFGSDKVRAVTGRMKYSDRSGVCNDIEIEKAKQFAHHYRVELNIVDFDYASRGGELFNNALPVMKKHGYCNITAINHSVLATEAKRLIGGEDHVVFAGEISDGAHNFGFSQYATMFHPSYGFREYADKMASYLFGPTFAKRLIESDYLSDPIYKLFYSDADFKIDAVGESKAEVIKQLLISFFLRNGRRPLWAGNNIGILTECGVKSYTDSHVEKYLSVADNAGLNELYSCYLRLYNSFHWQGSTVAPLQTMAAEQGLRSCLPFWDRHIQDFLSEMPEEWGRGLDLNNTKFPLKWMLENRLDYPMALQKGPHSYTYDIDHSFNHYEEVLCHSNLAVEVRATLESFSFGDILSSEVFDAAYIDRLKFEYLSGGKLSGVELVEVASLFFLAKTS